MADRAQKYGSPFVPTVDIIETIVNKMDRVIAILSVVEDPVGTFTLNVCRTYWITQASILTIGGNDYKVKDFVNDSQIVVTGSDPIVATEFTLSKPFYFHGTPRATSTEIKEEHNSNLKYPMIYVIEPMRENFDDDPESIIERSPSLKILFLDEPDQASWLTDDHYKYVIVPMNNAINEFVNEIARDGGFGVLSAHEVINHANWGTIKSDSGHIKKILNDKTSGSEFNSTIPILDTLVCKLSGSCVQKF